jgi:hypothetical protein
MNAMMPHHVRVRVAATLFAWLVACGGPAAPAASRTTPQPVPSPVPSTSDPTADTARAGTASPYVERARTDSLRNPYVEADVEFMYNMIGHHAQAITMSRWAPTHGASAEVQRLASRIINAQQDEIATMQQWLRDRGKPVPEIPSDGGAPMMLMNGQPMRMLMPGMLAPEQM